jgi:predicted transcriptional regulator
MSAKKKSPLEKPLTEVELELMDTIWDLAPCTIKEVQVEVSKRRELAYTSVATIMKILEQKGALQSRKDDRAHVYVPRLTRSEYETSSLQHLTANLFRGDPSSMVMRLLNDTHLTSEELKNIRKLLDERMGK